MSESNKVFRKILYRFTIVNLTFWNPLKGNNLIVQYLQRDIPRPVHHFCSKRNLKLIRNPLTFLEWRTLMFNFNS